MSVSRRSISSISLSWILLCVLMVALLIAGGEARADLLGQVVVRSIAWSVVVVALLFGRRLSFGHARPVAVLLIAALILVLAQLIPLPPEIWQALPGRAMLAEAAAASGQAQPWRPWSIVPGATASAAGSLIVPFAVLLLVGGVKDVERRWLPGLLLCLIAGSTLLALLQVSGTGLANPLLTATPGVVSGSFANRNHFALFVALGCLVVPVWVFLGGRSPHWRAPVGFGLVILFLLTILASGSRAGMWLGVLALGIGLFTVRGGIRRELSRYPRWVLPALIAAMAGVIAIFVLISVAADRALSVNRMFAVEIGQDMRSRGLSTVLAMIRAYFPFGSGFGGFDPIFRIHEPLALLQPTYFNHAHDDWLEIVLEGGLPAALLALAGLTWWGRASVRAWRAGSAMHHALPKLGSALLLLIFLASTVDYPIRTPMIMAVTVIAAWWLSDARRTGAGSALPAREQHL